jgi:hypothetical protein
MERNSMKKVLNVGGNNRSIKLPAIYEGWSNVLLDIDPRGQPDVVCDARELKNLAAAEYDAVYCSHNLEHYYRHDVARVLAGFLHVMKADAFAHIRVPDVGELMRVVVEKNLDIDDVLYQSPAGPIAVRDVIYGYGVEIERSGQDFYAHKTGFTRKSLTAALRQAGFGYIYAGSGNLEIAALAFKAEPPADTAKRLGIQQPA